MGLKSDIIKSLRWQVGAIILQKIITVVATIILARRLGPSAFGLLALALVVINAFDLLKAWASMPRLSGSRAIFKKRRGGL
jgi:O-antigen/teichoic acid export membrane protein